MNRILFARHKIGQMEYFALLPSLKSLHQDLVCLGLGIVLYRRAFCIYIYFFEQRPSYALAQIDYGHSGPCKDCKVCLYQRLM